jgi:hypothetical protein
MNLPEWRRIARFWARVDCQGTDACWTWTGAITQRGYGATSWRGRYIAAHRVAWLVTAGPIPDGLYVCHRCDNPPCCNPSHLFLGTHEDNMADRAAKGRNALIARPGATNGRARLTADDVTEMRRLHRQLGLNFVQLGRRYGIHKSHARQVIRGERWSGLPARPALNGDSVRIEPSDVTALPHRASSTG